jgi:excisionase family DNA binding protein
MEYHEGVIKNTEFFTTAELAEKLKMNVQVITRKVQSGEIQGYKIGKDWRIPEQSVYDWLQTLAQTKLRRRRTPTEAIQPPEQFDRKHLLEYILAQFEPNQEYSEAEVDRVIRRYANETDQIRRAILTRNMMERVDTGYRRRAQYRIAD